MEGAPLRYFHKAKGAEPGAGVKVWMQKRKQDSGDASHFTKQNISAVKTKCDVWMAPTEKKSERKGLLK